jgi:large subunit ribosomal protein L24
MKKKKEDRETKKIHVRKDDLVMVVSGADKGKKGKVMKVLPREGTVLVDGINIARKHTKPRPPKVPQGGILEKAMPIQSSRVMLMCSKCDKPFRIKMKVAEDGARTRICRRCNEEV